MYETSLLICGQEVCGEMGNIHWLLTTEVRKAF